MRGALKTTRIYLRRGMREALKTTKTYLRRRRRRRGGTENNKNIFKERDEG